jgi:PilZ domain-containing protein
VPDPVTTARSARESLARGLNALQAENVPPALLELAAPIAEAMGALHQIERSQGQALVPHAEVALRQTRGALSLLQSQEQSHPAVIAATEAVASSLGFVHALAKMAGGAQAAFPPARGEAAQAAPGVGPQQVQPYQQPVDARQPFKPGAAGPASAGSPLAATFGTPGTGASQRPPSPPMPAGDIPIVVADLGTHSPTNFYKGLSGNDIIDHGGLFVSTYMVPKIGTPVRLKISLPGGYEFEANGVVRWSREASDGGGGAPPGFGAQLTGITQEARQLVYRYARNREPLFHDDL